MDSVLEKRLYEKYDIDNLSRGAKTDALGDLYEEYVKIIFQTNEYIDNFNRGCQPTTVEEEVMQAVCKNFNITNIASVEFLKVPKTDAGGEPKTDLCILINENTYIKSTIKHSHCSSVSIAEFSVEAIVSAIGIEDQRTISLMEKHQREASAKNFTPEDKSYLTEGLSGCKKSLVLWALSGAPKPSEDLRVADFSINFAVDKNTKRMQHFVTHTMESLVDKITNRKSGFGTGLSWTYATGTKGRKIQYKGPTFL